MRSHRTRESKRIPLIEKICLLDHAYCPEFDNTQRHYVPYPIAPGPQPCLTVCIGSDGKERFTDSLVILPANPPHHPPISNPLYQSCLGLIKRTQGPLIRGLNGQVARIDSIVITNLIRSWGRSDWTQPPFQTSSHAWAPIHLAVRAVERHRDKHWWILSQWSMWQENALQPFDRHVEYWNKFRTGLRPQQPDHRIFRQVMGAFEKLYQEYLRLECNTRNDTRRMKRLRVHWRAPRTATSVGNC